VHNVNDLLQCVAVCCCVLDNWYVAVCCSVLQCFAMFWTLDILLDQSKGSCCRVLLGHQVCC